jgi:hypothetical protein
MDIGRVEATGEERRRGGEAPDICRVRVGWQRCRTSNHGEGESGRSERQEGGAAAHRGGKGERSLGSESGIVGSSRGSSLCVVEGTTEVGYSFVRNSSCSMAI